MTPAASFFVSLGAELVAYGLATHGHVFAAVVVAHTAGVALVMMLARTWGPRL